MNISSHKMNKSHVTACAYKIFANHFTNMKTAIKQVFTLTLKTYDQHGYFEGLANE